MPPKNDEESDITEEIRKRKKIGKEFMIVKDEIVKTLEILKKTQKEYLDMVEKHQNYWNSELEKIEYKNTERREKLKKTLKMEEKICNKLRKELQRTDERIEFHKKYAHSS